MKLVYLLLAGVLCALALGACGGSDSGGDATASTKVPPEIAEAVSTGLRKDKYSAQLGEVVKVTIDGAEATAVVKLSGGTLDGQTAEATLSEGKKGWALDGFSEFIGFDKQLLVKNYQTETEELPENFKPAIVSCLTKQFGDSSQERMESMYLDREKAVFIELGRRCFGN